MADRTTKVVLTAVVSSYLQGMEQAAVKTRALGAASEKLAQQRQGFDVLGRSMLAVGALAAAAVGIAIKQFAEFDAKMSQVQALSHATADEMNVLSNAALHLGQAIGFTASEVADAEIELVKAGISVADIMGGALSGALQLAAAGQIDVAQATEIATIAMTQFGLKGAQIPHVADLLAAGADKALGGVGDLGEALKSGGLVAAQFGVSLEETSGTLAAFANAGLIGEVAGTDLRQMLLKLAAPAADAQASMEALGISIYDQTGAFVGVTNLAGQLKDKLSKLTPEQRNATLATIFGARAIAGANVLYNEGAEGIAKWTDEVNDSGFAARQAAGKMDNLKGDLSKLEAAFNTGLIETGSSANDVLRLITQNLTGLVSIVSDAPQPVLAAGLALTGLVAIIGVVGGTALLAVPQIGRFREGLTALGISGRAAGIGIGLASAGIAVAGLALTILAQRAAQAAADTQELQASLDEVSGATTQLTRTTVAQKLADADAFALAKRAGISRLELVDAAIAGGQKLDAVNQKLNDFNNGGLQNGVSQFDQIGNSYTIGKIDDLSTHLGDAEQDFKDVKVAAEQSGEGTADAAAGYKDAADQAAQLQSNLTDLIDTINKANGVGQDAVSTNASYRQTISDINDVIDNAHKGVDGYSTSLDESTAAGSKNADMFQDLARKSQDAAKAQFDLDGNAANYKATLEAGRQALIDQITSLTGSADAAQLLADKIYAIPPDIAIQALVDTSRAAQQLIDFRKSLDAFQAQPLNLTAYVRKVGGSENGNLYNSGKAQAFENGGIPTGIYAGRTGGIYKFAEENVGWEAFISGKPGMEARNRNIWAEAGRRLGVPASQGHSVSGSPTHISGDTNLTLNEVSDPVGTANAVIRRLNLERA